MADSLSGQVLNVQELKKLAEAKDNAKLQEILSRRNKEEAEEKR